ncbi:MAG: TonB family protein [Candidatus Eisenbacteria bacterium]
MNQSDRLPSLRRNYYRRVRNALIAAGVLHAAVFALAPAYRPVPAIMRADPLRVLPAGGGWGRAVVDLASSGGAVASPALSRTSPLAGVIQAAEQDVASEQWSPPSSGGGAGGPSSVPTGNGETLEEDAAPVYYGYDTAPRALRTFEPIYPLAAKISGFEGTVVININLDERGSILRAWVASASAPELLVAAALDAAYQFQFSPGRWRGVPVRSTVAVPFRFFLKRIS